MLELDERVRIRDITSHQTRRLGDERSSRGEDGLLRKEGVAETVGARCWHQVHHPSFPTMAPQHSHLRFSELTQYGHLKFSEFDHA